jgi:dihydroflavonol-4-reductase
MYDINVEGTRNVLNAALRAGVSKVVYTSSRATIGPSEPGRLADEQTPWRGELPDDYFKSKLLAEREALEICARGLPVVVVNPTFVVGPGRPSPSGQAIVDFLNRRFPGYIEHHENFVYVGDVVKGHILAKEKGRAGERYILGSENLSIREFLDLLEEVSGVRAPRLRFPYLPALLTGYLYEALARVTRTPPPFTVGFIRETRTDMRCDISRAKRELGYETTPIREAFRITVEWLRENGYAP